MEATQSHLDQILDEIASLSLDDQEMLLNIIKQRHIERKREQILKDSRETMRAYKKGLAKRGTVNDLMRDLASD
jgi:DNA-binding NtrC family response regulator